MQERQLPGGGARSGEGYRRPGRAPPSHVGHLLCPARAAANALWGPGAMGWPPGDCRRSEPGGWPAATRCDI